MAPTQPSAHLTTLRTALHTLLVAAAVCSCQPTGLADEEPAAKKPATEQPAAQKPRTKTKAKASDQDTIQIIPAAKVPAGGFQNTSGKGSSTKPSDSAVRLASAQAAADAYRRVYRSIPYNRRLSLVNPGYRHDATMELLTENARRADSRSESARPASSASSRSSSTPDP